MLLPGGSENPCSSGSIPDLASTLLNLKAAVEQPSNQDTKVGPQWSLTF